MPKLTDSFGNQIKHSSGRLEFIAVKNAENSAQESRPYNLFRKIKDYILSYFASSHSLPKEN